MTRNELAAWLTAQGLNGLDDVRAFQVIVPGPDGGDTPIHLEVEVYLNDEEGHRFVIFDQDATGDPWVAARETRMFPLTDWSWERVGEAVPA